MNTDTNALLRRLGLGPLNPGAWSGTHGWSSTTDGALLNVRNPANGTLIAQVRPASADDYEHVVSSAVEIAVRWREVPAPKRGEVVRLIGEELRGHRQDLTIVRVTGILTGGKPVETAATAAGEA